MAKTPCVYLVDDDPALRDSLRLLCKTAGLRLEGFANAAQFLENFKPDQPCCLVLDVRLNGNSGLDLQDHLKHMAPALPIIVVTGHGDVPAAVRALKAGAFDFLEKPFNDKVLLSRIDAAIELSRKRRKQEVKRQIAAGRRATLTRREREVMDLMLVGKTNPEIAVEMGISPKTLDIHRSKVMQKMQAESVGQLMLMGLSLQN